MPRYNVRLPDGRWQVFSSIVDDFVCSPMTFDELREFRHAEYGAPYEETDTLLTDKPRANVMSYEDALQAIREHEKWEVA